MSWLRERRGVWRGMAASLGLLAAAGLRGQALGPAPAPPAPRPIDLPAGTLLFHRNVVRDTDGTGLEAYTIDLPAGWQGESQVLWDLDRKVAPSDLLVRVVNPRAGQEFMYLPSVIFVWSPKYQAMAAQLKGTIQGCRILEPVDGPVVALQKLVIPGSFKDLEGKYTVTSSQELPELAAAYAPTYNRPGRPQRVVRAGKVRIEYAEAGRTMQQDVYCVFILARASGGVIWELDHTVSFKEEKGIPDQTDRQFALMAASLQPTVKFLDAQEKMTELLIQGASHDPKALMQAVARAESAPGGIPPTIMSDWQARQDAEAEAVKYYEAGGISRVTDERDPHSGDLLPIPSDIAHVWSNSAGDIVYTDSAAFQPTEVMPADWQELKPATP